jgi:hypothetical protein
MTLVKPNSLVTIGQTSLVGVGHSRLDSIVPLIFRTVCCTMAGVLTLYYRTLRTALTLLRMGISLVDHTVEL